ncbi:Yap1 redox domain [Lasallia pustulata]|uniref:Yap1 redox domain n=1 Tax=Lasallia pustulata TaxID=136370 RepID=A0A1W5CUT9_9LECA|nr:Yap1 redox domain [Lasallia pustulata]
MASKSAQDTTFNPDLYLSPDQQELLRTALSSNSSGRRGIYQAYPASATDTTKPSAPRSNSDRSTQLNGAGVVSHEMYESPIDQVQGSGALGSLGFDDSPFLDYDLDDGNFEWDNSGDQMIGNLPGTSGNEEDTELHEKRKGHGEDQDNEDGGGGKRREGEERTTKKPGRKPLTSEPTSKRKAQNRAAQRAFRERKERHLKELENKVEDLEKASESANHENGVLRAHVDQLQTELQEYRKRLSLNGTGLGRSPPSSAGLPSGIARKSYNSTSSNDDFQFGFPEFPIFGTSAVSHASNDGPRAKDYSPAQNYSPRQRVVDSGSYDQRHAVDGGHSTNRSPQSLTQQIGTTPVSMADSGAVTQTHTIGGTTAGVEALSSLFSPSILQSASRSNSTDYMSYGKGNVRASPIKQHSTDSSGHTPNLNRASSTSITTSPSASSMSHNGLQSSCDTSPEPSCQTPDTRKASDSGLNTINEEWMHQVNPGAKSLVNDVNGIDWMAQQNGGLFDPELFGDYRDPQDNILNAEFGGFFSDAFPVQDFTSPFYTGEIASPAATKRDLMKEVDNQKNGNDHEVPTSEGATKTLNCTELWDRVQTFEKDQGDANLDIDSLCSELKAKAKCHETGAGIDEKDVNEILGRAVKEGKE